MAKRMLIGIMGILLFLSVAAVSVQSNSSGIEESQISDALNNSSANIKSAVSI